MDSTSSSQRSQPLAEHLTSSCPAKAMRMCVRIWLPANIPCKKLSGSQFRRITKEPILSDKLLCTNECRYSWCGRRDLNPYGLPHAPQTCAYANSATTAEQILLYLLYGGLSRGHLVKISRLARAAARGSARGGGVRSFPGRGRSRLRRASARPFRCNSWRAGCLRRWRASPRPRGRSRKAPGRGLSLIHI